MKKKILIVLSSVMAVIVLIVILSFTLFSLRTVELDYRTNKTYITESDDEIIESGEIKMGGSVFFRNKNKYIEKIESKNPYIKVINIETVFPSKFVIHVAERQKVFAIEYNNQFYITDNEFKVLEITNNYTSTQTNAMLLTGIQIADENYAVGQFMNINGYQPIYEALFENNRPLNEQITLIESINLTSIYDDVLKVSQSAIELKFFNGQTYIIYNSSYGLTYKVELMLDVFSQIYTYIGKNITVDGQDIILTEDNLKTATIEIKNFYDYREYGEEDCYFNIIPSNI